jgi:DNA-binding transcriptional ArsR family regulator
MAFLVKAELKTVATIPIIDKITNLDDEIVENIIDESISLMKGHLSRYYDAGKIFDKEGGERHLTVLKYLKDIVIYEIYERHTREQNEVALRRYGEAMDWLEKLNTGEHGDNTLPAAPGEDGESEGQAGDTRFGGNRRYGSIY